MITIYIIVFITYIIPIIPIISTFSTVIFFLLIFKCIYSPLK